MRIDQKDIDHAILHIFMDSRVHEGEWIFMESLLEQWPNTQLREADIYDGLRHLGSLGYLETDRSNYGTFITITDAGYSMAAGLGTRMQELGDFVSGRSVNHFVRKLLAGSSPSDMTRRKADHFLFE